AGCSGSGEVGLSIVLADDREPRAACRRGSYPVSQPGRGGAEKGLLGRGRLPPPRGVAAEGARLRVAEKRGNGRAIPVFSPSRPMTGRKPTPRCFGARLRTRSSAYRLRRRHAATAARRVAVTA